MVEHVIIDGNNLLHTLREHAPIAAVGRETMVRIVARWAKNIGCKATLIFDGPAPRPALLKQLSPEGLTVRFSAPATADDVIVAIIQDEIEPARLRVVTSDNAIRHAAGYRRCRCTDAVSFAAELFPTPEDAVRHPHPPDEKPADIPPAEVERWRQAFGGEEDEPFDGFDAMIH